MVFNATVNNISAIYAYILVLLHRMQNIGKKNYFETRVKV